MPLDQIRKGREMDIRRRPRSRPVRHAGAVADDVKAQLAVGRLGATVNFIDRRRPLTVRHHQLKMLDHALDAAIYRLLIGEYRLAVHVNVHGPGRQILDRRVDNLQAFQHLFHAHEIPRVAIAFLGTDHLKQVLEIGIREVRLILADIAHHAAGPRDWSSAAQVDRQVFREDADALRALEENAVAVQQPAHVGVRLREFLNERADLANEVVADVEEQPADARVARVEPLSGDRLENIVEKFPLIESIEKRRERPEVERLGASAEQMIANAGQLADYRADVFAPRRQLDAHQLLDTMMPGNLVGDRRDVIHAIDDGDVLIEVEIFAKLLEAAMKKTDVRDRLDHRFAVEREDEAQGRMRGRVLRTEIEGPQVIFLRPFGKSLQCF